MYTRLVSFLLRWLGLTSTPLTIELAESKWLRPGNLVPTVHTNHGFPGCFQPVTSPTIPYTKPAQMHPWCSLRN